MAFILQLPVELLDYIVELSGLEQLIRLSFVCRIFNAIAIPHAYRHVSLRDRHQKDPSIQLFLRTLLDRPSVGEHVRELDIELTDPLTESQLRCFPGEPESDAAASGDLRRLAADAASYGLSSEIETALLNGSIGAMVFLLLSHLPALQSLEMNPLMPCNDLFFRLISDSSSLPSGLQSLRSVTLSHWDTSPLNWNRISQFLCLPNLSAIHCNSAVIEAVDPVTDHDSEESDDDEDSSEDEQENHTAYSLNKGLEKGCSGVEVIRLEECVVDDEPLAALVTFSRCLKSLEYRHDFTSPDVIFTARPLGHALRQCARTSLENLELDFDFDALQFTEPPGSLGSLRDFVQLKHISTAISLLLDEPWHGLPLHLSVLLPPSLISLSLWIDPDWEAAGWDVVLVQLLETKHEHVPLFKTLRLGGSIDGDEEATIWAACVSAQVELILSMGRNRIVPPPSPVALNSNATLVAPPAEESMSDTLSPTQPGPSTYPALPDVPSPAILSVTNVLGKVPEPPTLLTGFDEYFERDFGQWFNPPDINLERDFGQWFQSENNNFMEPTSFVEELSDPPWILSDFPSYPSISTLDIPDSLALNNFTPTTYSDISTQSESIQPSSQFTQIFMDAISSLSAIPDDVSVSQPGGDQSTLPHNTSTTESV